MFRIFSRPGITTTVLLAPITIAGAAYGITVYQSTKATDRRRIEVSSSFSDSFRRSKSITSITNPRSHQLTGDSYAIAIKVPKNTSDERILALFVKGFFGGNVIAPERIALSGLGLTFVKFSSLQDAAVTKHIWSRAELSEERLPPMCATVFGAFQVTDVQLSDTHSDTINKTRRSYIDFGWGSDSSFMNGVHRFSIERESGKEAQDEDTAKVLFESAVCNPTTDQPVGPKFLFRFHQLYSGLLFREAIAEVKRGTAWR